MPAPKGNKNGVSTRYKPISDEPTVTFGVRLSRSLAEEIESELETTGVKKSHFTRNAIAHALDCPLNSPEITAGFDAIAASLNLSRSELVEQIGRGLLIVTPKARDRVEGGDEQR